MNYLFIKKFIDNALKKLNYKNINQYSIEHIKKIEFGDFATNVAMIIAKRINKNPIQIADAIAKEIKKNSNKYFSKIEIAKPGFINFFINPNFYQNILKNFLTGTFKLKMLPKNKRKKINFEFVSANPTGSLHLGHVRNAYVSQTLFNVLKILGHKVISDYWINDMGSQVDLFELSCLCRYLELQGIKNDFPKDGYKGKDPYEIAQKMSEKFGKKFVNAKYNDLMIEDKKVKQIVNSFAIGCMLDQIKAHLKMIGVSIKLWTSEYKIYHSGILEKLLNGSLKKYVYTKDGATWLKTTLFKIDDKDRVIIKKDGSRTYMLTDIGNQYNKKLNGFDLFLHVWGSDHEGHVKKMKSIMPMINIKPEVLEVVLIEMVKIVNNGQEVKLSKRSGNAITIPDMLEMMSVDTSRWYILAQAPKTKIVIDLAKVSKTDNTNPVFYVQYAHARISQLLKKVKLKDKSIPKSFTTLTSNNERTIINMLLSLESIIHLVANNYEPHRLTTYLHELAKVFHAWYNECKIKDIVDLSEKKEKYYLAKSVAVTIKFVLKILGISAPTQMKHLQ
ncbi:arginine--tRNA ligase [Mycoplasmoides alvi]|uniref:arginine--tRNA ligase n=1 Tax=Mycoplasmoides alvi TaxID=78580 RepID=UPI00051BAAF5|nr:arginine--tRNA ligase [Mycoplasmoides alvi]